MTTHLRTLAGAAALVAGLWFLSPAGGAPPALPPGTYKKAAEADLAFLQNRLGELAALPAEDVKDAKRKPAVTAAMTLAAYGEALGDKDLTDNALKVAAAVIKKDVKGAADMGKKLAIKPGTPGKGEMPKLDKFDVELAMTAMRNEKTGGLNIEKDIKDMISQKDPKPVKPAEVELLATRAAVMMDYAGGLGYDDKFPSGLPANKQNKELWTKWMKESVELTRQIAEEAGKPKADEKKLLTMLKTLDGKCYECHNKFRFEP
ncbi:MAG TPA: hypothetical protein VKE74_10205 [Gemmataceae bacterium]|nr:hypothetical protein [Gemmataceae bacterium]